MAAAAWASGVYGGVREHGQAATCLRACASKRASARRREAAFSLRSSFGEGGPAEAGNAVGGLFQHSHGLVIRVFQSPTGAKNRHDDNALAKIRLIA